MLAKCTFDVRPLIPFCCCGLASALHINEMQDTLEVVITQQEGELKTRLNDLDFKRRPHMGVFPTSYFNAFTTEVGIMDQFKVRLLPGIRKSFHMIRKT